MRQLPQPCTRRSSASGLTLIELIVVIVILGVLAATALPKFLSMGGDARKAVVSQMAGNLQSLLNSAPSLSALRGAVSGLPSASPFDACPTALGWKKMNWNANTPVLVGGQFTGSCAAGAALYLHVFYLPQLVGVNHSPITSFHLGTATPNYASGSTTDDGHWILTYSSFTTVSLQHKSAPDPANCAVTVTATTTYSAMPVVSTVTSGC